MLKLIYAKTTPKMSDFLYFNNNKKLYKFMECATGINFRITGIRKDFSNIMECENKKIRNNQEKVTMSCQHLQFSLYQTD